jgi:hypothetical protein
MNVADSAVVGLTGYPLPGYMSLAPGVEPTVSIYFVAPTPASQLTVTLLPFVIGPLGVGEIKFAGDGCATTRAKFAVNTFELPLAVTANGNDPVADVADGVIVSVVVPPEGGSTGGLNVYVAPIGSPDTLSVGARVNPAIGLMPIV